MARNGETVSVIPWTVGQVDLKRWTRTAITQGRCWPRRARKPETAAPWNGRRRRGVTQPPPSATTEQRRIGPWSADFLRLAVRSWRNHNCHGHLHRIVHRPADRAARRLRRRRHRQTQEDPRHRAGLRGQNSPSTTASLKKKPKNSKKKSKKQLRCASTYVLEIETRPAA